MSKPILIVAAVCLLGSFGWGQISGSWDTHIYLLPDPELSYTKLDLNYTINNMWTISSMSKFTEDGFTDQAFGIKGMLAIAEIDGLMVFLPTGEVLVKDTSYTLAVTDPNNVEPYADILPSSGFSATWIDSKWGYTGPAYQCMTLSATMDILGVTFSAEWAHTVNHVVRFDANAFPGLIYDIGSIYIELQTDSDSATWTAKRITADDWIASNYQGACASKYWNSGATPELLYSRVIVEYEGMPPVVITGPFEVWEYNDQTSEIVLSENAMQYIAAWIAEEWAKAGNGAFADWTVEPNITMLKEPNRDNVTVAFLLPTYHMLTLAVDHDPFTASVVFDDICTGLQFHSATLGFTGLSLCCGIVHDATVSFSKCGFEYFRFTADSLFPLCCGITFDAAVTFTVDSKVVSVTPRFEGVGQVCVTVFADVVWDETQFSFQGIDIYGWKIRCELGDCAYLELLTALNVAEVEKALAKNDDHDKKLLCEIDEYEHRPIFGPGEFEYIKLGFCGPGCCGGTYSVDVALYFQDNDNSLDPTLFGITRIKTEARAPIMNNLYLRASFAMDAVGNNHKLGIGWEFSF